MKALQNHLILFDAECPMCRAYTKAFVQTGMLDHNCRAAYQEAQHVLCPLLDRQRAANEIALVDLKSGEVTYGIRSLFKIFGNAWPLFKPLFAFSPFVWIMSKTYAFISYNRRVIIPPQSLISDNTIQPSFKLHYRIAYLLVTWLATGYILTAYAHLLVGLVPLGNPFREYLICGAQIVFQGVVIYIFAKDKLWSYLGNMMTISCAGSLLLLVPLASSHCFTAGPVLFTCCFMAVAGLMLAEHIRRTQLLKLGWVMTVSWVLYRLFVLGMILI